MQIQALASLISLQILKLPYTLDHLEPTLDGEYGSLGLLDTEAQRAIHLALWNAAQGGSNVAAPAALAWSVILQSIKQANAAVQKLEDAHSEDEGQPYDANRRLNRQSSVVISNELTKAAENLAELQGGEATSQNLAKCALDECDLFGVVAQLARLLAQLFSSIKIPSAQIHAGICLLELLRQGLLVTTYCSEVVDVALALLQGSSSTKACNTELDSITAHGMIATTFLHDDSVLSTGLLYQSQTRYPLELIPFLELTRALIPDSHSSPDDARTLPLSEATATFTHMLPPGFSGYEVTREDQEANCIKLTADLPLFNKRRLGPAVLGGSSESQALVLGSSEIPELCIPRGTIGHVISESRPPLVMWRHQHSTLKYIGLLLSTVSPGATKVPSIDNGVVDRDAQIQIIQLMSSMLDSIVSAKGGNDHQTGSSTAQAILEEASDDLDRNEDIITVVSDIFENELSYRGPQNDESSAELLSSCLQFFAVVAKVLPNRIWPVLGRSGFLGLSGSGSKMISSVVSSETISQQQQIYRQSISLLDALVTDVVTRAASRKTPSTQSSSRYDLASSSAGGTTQKLTAKVMLAYSQQALALLQWFCTLPRETQIAELSTTSKILGIYSRIVEAVFCFDDARKPEDKIVAALVSAAEFIITSISDGASQPLIASVLTIGSTTVHADTLDNSSAALECQDYLVALVTFFKHILRINLLRDTPFSRLDDRLLSILPFFARLYAANVKTRQALLALFTALIRRSDSTNSDSASFLSHLAANTGKDLFALLSQLLLPLSDGQLDKDVWDFLTAIARSKQQTLITFIATGDTAKNTLRQKDGDDAKSPSRTQFVSVALDAISDAASLANSTHISILRFLCSMQQSWPGVTSSIRKHSAFLTKITDHLGNLTVGTNKSGVSQALQINAAHMVVDILSLYIHNMRQMNDTSLIKQLTPNLSYLKGQGVAVPAYNVSLHSNLKKNFENRYPGCSLSMFKHSGKSEEELGTNYYYDLKFANQLLSFDPSWSRSNGFAAEFSRANENLSLVEAQIRLTGSWKSLAIELSMVADQDKVLQQSLANTVEQCLVANTQSTPLEAFFESLFQSRTELAHVLLQRLTTFKAHNPTMLSLLASTWQAIRASGQDFELAFLGGNTPYLRMVLSILLLALQPHTRSDLDSSAELNGSTSRGRRTLGASGSRELAPGLQSSRDDVLALVLELGIEVVGKGFCSLANQIHDDPNSIQPSDFALITAIFRSILKVNDVSLVHAQLTLRLADNNVHRYALALFSWSDRLLGADTDPIIGELSISFIRELTEIPQMSEFLATQGVLGQLDTTPLLNYLRERQSGFGPSDKPERMHVIWARGLLPIVLNVVIAVGESFAAEATAFVNSFPHQLNRAATAFGSRASSGSAVTLDVAAEVHTLSLIALALDRYRASPAAVAVAGGDIPELAFDQNALRDDLEAWINGNGAGGRSKIAATNDREAGLARTKAEEGSGAESKLEELVLRELKGAVSVLGVVAGVKEA